MGELRISIPGEMHKALKQSALDKGITLKQLIADILERYTRESRQDKRRDE